MVAFIYNVNLGIVALCELCENSCGGDRWESWLRLFEPVIYQESAFNVSDLGSYAGAQT